MRSGARLKRIRPERLNKTASFEGDGQEQLHSMATGPSWWSSSKKAKDNSRCLRAPRKARKRHPRLRALDPKSLTNRIDGPYWVGLERPSMYARIDLHTTARNDVCASAPPLRAKGPKPRRVGGREGLSETQTVRPTTKASAWNATKDKPRVRDASRRRVLDSGNKQGKEPLPNCQSRKRKKELQ